MDPVEVLQSLLVNGLEWASSVPILSWIIRYIGTSLYNDPWRLFLEAALFIVLLNYLLQKRYKPTKNYVKLSKKEIDDLVEEWEPEPLISTPPPRHHLDLNSALVIDE